MASGNALDLLLYAISMIGAILFVVGQVWFVRTKLSGDAMDVVTVLAFLTVCVPFLPFVILPLLVAAGGGASAKRPALLVLVGCVLMLAWWPYESRADARRLAAAKAEYEAAGSVTSSQAAPLAASPPPPPQTKLPAPDAKSVDLSTVMGRARAFANEWQREATLVSIEASQLTRNGIDTEKGGSAKVTFGPSPFAAASKPRSFVVTYDKAGFQSGPQDTKPGPALTEPMCAPERIYDLAAGANGSLSLNYGLDAQGRPAWLVPDPSAPKTKPRAFDAQTCSPLAIRR